MTPSTTGRRIPRRLTKVAAAVVLVLAAASAAEAATDKSAEIPKLRVVEQGAAVNVAVYVAQERGFFKKVGVNVETVTIRAGAADLIAALTSKNVDIILQTPLTLQNAVRAGAPIAFFMGNGNADADLVVSSSHKDVPAASEAGWRKTVLAMRGMTVGESVRGNMTGVLVESIFAQAGLQGGKDVTFLVSGAGPTSVAALRAGQIDAFVSDSFGVASAVSQGIGRDVLSLQGGDGPLGYSKWIQTGAIARRADLLSNPTAYAKYGQAIDMAIKFIRNPSNKGALAQILAKQYALPTEAAAIIADRAAKIYTTHISPPLLASTLRLAKDGGILEGTLSAYPQLVVRLKALTKLGLYR
jgi:ABC-type nitrate/sulfonate/bicarbonate transport system substrate-binding protein